LFFLNAFSVLVSGVTHTEKHSIVRGVSGDPKDYLKFQFTK
jgi:hypothetical protein